MIELQEEKETIAEIKKPKVVSAGEREQLFKIAFRNYIDLTGLADKKAGLLIQVNSIVATLAYGLMIKIQNTNNLNYVPLGIILISSIVTIFYSVLASKPRENKLTYTGTADKELFFFGSFDRLDPSFKNVSWEKYSSDITAFFKGEKKNILSELIKESFNVRKVLSRKFIYLSIAYKVFFAGLVLGAASFIVLYI